jgi:hypothetical protein
MIYFFVRMRRHRTRLKRDLDPSPDVLEDRAHNQLRLAESEAAILERDGIETTRARALLAESKSRLDVGDFVRARTLAQSAHEQLVTLRKTATTPYSSPSSSEAQDLRENGSRPEFGFGDERLSTNTLSFGSSATVPGPPASTPQNPPEGPRLAKNRAESQFETNRLNEELERLRLRHPDDPRLAEGIRYLAGSRSAYQAGDFTEALRLSLRGRRSIGAQIGSLGPPSPGTRLSSHSTAPVSLQGSPERLVGGTVCPACGRPTRPGDRFCRTCGAHVGSAMCPRCGKPLTDGDQFCATCGAPLEA